MTIAYSCLCFVSITRGLITKPIDFLRVPPLKFVRQIVWFFSFLISLSFDLFFSVYIYVWFYLLQSNCNNGYFSRTSLVNFLKVNKYILFLLFLWYPRTKELNEIWWSFSTICWFSHQCFSKKSQRSTCLFEFHESKPWILNFLQTNAESNFRFLIFSLCEFDM